MTQSPDLEGKVAVVTGAGRGVGRAVGTALAAHGARVALIARGAEQLEETRRAILEMGGSAVCFSGDVTQPEVVLRRLRADILETMGQPTILVNSAGAYGPVALLKDSDPEHWIRTLEVNTIGAYLLCRAFVGGMIEAGWGRIVNVSSAATLHTPGPLNSAYATSKIALNAMTRVLAAELVGTGVTANLLHPGDVKTAMWQEIKDNAAVLGPEGSGIREWAAWVEETGGDPPEKAGDLVLHLVSDAASTINGEFLWIADGLQTPAGVPWKQE